MRSPRFAVPLADEAARLNASVAFDQRLCPYDVAGSKAHARMLAAKGILSTEDADKICAGLDQVQGEWERGELGLDERLEDIHMNVETRLVEIIGDAGKRLHTARSRNDQVATDLRLYARDAAARLLAGIKRLRLAFVKQARAHVDTLLPGYTHLQRAQPTRLAHHFLAYDAMLSRDAERIRDAARRGNRSPLGSGALTGTTFPIDRALTSSTLGFDSPTENTLDTVGDRDFAIELCAAAAICAAHLSRLGEELVLWSAQEFGFVRLPEGYCSGSSIMPQKVNPDIPELVRAKAGRVTGNLVALLTVVKGLPLAYNKDLQETQEPLYDTVETVELCLAGIAGCIEGAAFSVESMRDAVNKGFVVATELADYLTAKGMPFRESHQVTGALVRLAASRGIELSGLALDDLKQHAPIVEKDVYEWLDPGNAVDRRDVIGGPARARVLAELDRVERELGAGTPAR